MNFCDRLRKARQRVGFTQQQVADMLGITKSTYCGYETGKRQPDISKLRRLSLLLCTSVDELLELTDGSSSHAISPLEYEQVKQWRALDVHGQRLIRLVLNEETARQREQAFACAAARSPEAAVPFPIAKQRITAEFGAYLGPDGFLCAQVRCLPHGAQYGLCVGDDTMEPRFHPLDVLAVSTAAPAQPGDIGVFMKNGLSAVRILGIGELLPFRDTSLSIPIGPDIRTCGTVLGVLPADDIL